MADNKTILVTRPAMPPLEEVMPLLEQIWRTRFLTNRSHFERQLNRTLCAEFGVEHLVLVANATLGLMLALRTLRGPGEVITTPFTFIATPHSVLWNNLEPVFVDIDRVNLGLDPVQVERAITPRTRAILAVHCLGSVCDVDALEAIAAKHNLKVIYDAAHAFAMEMGGESIVRRGDFSVLSFHATKVFNTFEGGAIVCRNAEDGQRLDRMMDNGISGDLTVDELGLNAKMNEFSAAVGLAQLPHVADAIESRRRIDERYRERLGRVKGVSLIDRMPGIRSNFSYFPILIEPEFRMTSDELNQHLLTKGIRARRYFHPLVSVQKMYSSCRGASPKNLPVATSISDRILCIPIYPGLTSAEQDLVIESIEG